MIDVAWREKLCRAFEQTAGEELAGQPAAQGERGTRIVPNLLRRASAIKRLFTHPKLLAAAWHVLKRPFRLSDVHGREPQRGFGQQALHADWGPRAPRGPFHFFNSLWLLDEFTPDNGSTRVVPGTHHYTRPIDKALSSPASHHPDEQQVLAAAGSVLLFNGHLWHSGTCNTTGKPRRVIQSSYVAAENRHVAPVSIEIDELLDASIMCLL